MDQSATRSRDLCLYKPVPLWLGAHSFPFHWSRKVAFSWIELDWVQNGAGQSCRAEEGPDPRAALQPCWCHSCPVSGCPVLHWRKSPSSLHLSWGFLLAWNWCKWLSLDTFFLKIKVQHPEKVTHLWVPGSVLFHSDPNLRYQVGFF